MRLEGKKILLGICGGIAAYKSLSLIRLLKKEGAEVRCVCTPAALHFVTPLTLETLSGNPVYSDLFAPKNEFSTAHIGYAEWADFLVVAPATANTLAKFAHGIADNALSTLFNAYTKRALVVPAMNVNMYGHPATQANLKTLRNWGVSVMEPESGFLACGTQGQGRMPEPEAIRDRILDELALLPTGMFAGKRVLVTSGPTCEAIDPVRFITNHATGLMGCCLADELTRRGAEVHLVCGPTNCRPVLPPGETVAVRTAEEMYRACAERWGKMDMGILAAAVADYTPKTVSRQKIKKTDADLQLDLVRTRDILKTLGTCKKPGQLLVGFAMETENEEENAKRKLSAKNADMIVLNSLRTPGAGFAVPTNEVCMFDVKGGALRHPLADKREIAAAILDRIETVFGAAPKAERAARKKNAKP